MKRVILCMCQLATFFYISASPIAAHSSWWEFQSIDTMKFSRDPSREFASKLDELETIADTQMQQIADTGATHVGVATPYDEEFLPVLKVWVTAARNHHLHIWFRGNWSGWEGWFGYARINRDQHLQKTVAFIRDNSQLFSDGDVFSACPECENGGPGDPRMNGDVDGHRQFLIAEYQATTKAFADINKQVDTTFNSMNADVARLIMDKPTTQALGGMVVVDHYVKSSANLNQDLTYLAEHSGGQVVLGEFGAPIPDLHGNMSDQQQAQWLDETLAHIAGNKHVIGVSYWTNKGGSTAIWRDNDQAKPAVEVLQRYYKPVIAQGKVINSLGQISRNGQVTTSLKRAEINDRGQFHLPVLSTNELITISAPGYNLVSVKAEYLSSQPIIELTPTRTNLWYKIQFYWKQLTIWTSHYFSI